jgi:hypothetical protein
VAGGPAVAPGGRSTGPRGVLCAIGIGVAGQPGAMAWRRLIAAVMSSVQGQRAESRSLSRRPPRTIGPATENSRGRRRLGSRRRAVQRQAAAAGRTAEPRTPPSHRQQQPECHGPASGRQPDQAARLSPRPERCSGPMPRALGRTPPANQPTAKTTHKTATCRTS